MNFSEQMACMYVEAIVIKLKILNRTDLCIKVELLENDLRIEWTEEE